ncbi:MAG TPA: transcriptional regulator NrdR [Candidatus Limnocylindrales bacterium]|nr:transcriptional regulator NrdR [Candidatus Limnocylindrales bacterium]
MKCPVCEKDEDKVIDSRSARGGSVIRRRRECLSCGHRFTTYETIEQAPIYVIKKDGRREPFNREKLLSGILMACKKRPIPMETLETIVQEIETKIHNNFPIEVPSRVIGEMVMDRLQELDEVAYVRFASVYRQFKNAQEFMEESEAVQKRRIQKEMDKSQLWIFNQKPEIGSQKSF